MIIVDASVWVSSIVVDDVNHAVSYAWAREWNLRGGEFAAPVLLLSEVAGSVARRHRLPGVGQRALITMLRDPTLNLVEIDRELAASAAQLSARLLLRGADAIYVALALQLNVALITWDNEQIRRASNLVDVRMPTLS
ncbi:MAG: type II toxin-antitoxin system VapC family toxin [Thermomicrobiales bacterium]